MARTQRLLVNLFGGWWRMRRNFPPALLDELAAAIAAGERTHLGELRFVIESRLGIAAVLAGVNATARARQVFAEVQVWDTELNSGVLFYLLLAEQRVEIVVDRGVARRVPQARWDAVCADMSKAYARGQWREGSVQGVAAVHALLREVLPANGAAGTDELPDRPVLL